LKSEIDKVEFYAVFDVVKADAESESKRERVKERGNDPSQRVLNTTILARSEHHYLGAFWIQSASPRPLALAAGSMAVSKG
jgi:hypothetical protein